MTDNLLDRVQTPNVDNFGKSPNFTKKDVSKIGKHNFANIYQSYWIRIADAELDSRVELKILLIVWHT